jgi:hypothetical protein
VRGRWQSGQHPSPSADDSRSRANRTSITYEAKSEAHNKGNIGKSAMRPHSKASLSKFGKSRSFACAASLGWSIPRAAVYLVVPNSHSPRTRSSLDYDACAPWGRYWRVASELAPRPCVGVLSSL